MTVLFRGTFSRLVYLNKSDVSSELQQLYVMILTVLEKHEFDKRDVENRPLLPIKHTRVSDVQNDTFALFAVYNDYTLTATPIP